MFEIIIKILLLTIDFLSLRRLFRDTRVVFCNNNNKLISLFILFIILIISSFNSYLIC